MRPESFEEFRTRKVQLFSRLKLRNIFPGEWESIWTGDGIEFASIRPLEPGDDLRELDLHRLVQSGEEEIIQRAVGRQMQILVWADWSGSMRRFQEMLFSEKAEIRDIAVGLLVFSAWNSYNPVGLCAFAKDVLHFFPARSGERYCTEILEWMIEEEYRGAPQPADIRKALSFLFERAAPQSLVFLVSDYQDPVFDGDFVPLLRQVAERFDFVPVVIRDPLEEQVALSRSVRVAVRDSEGRATDEIDLTPKRLK